VRGYASFQEVWISDFRKLTTMSTIVKVQRKGQVTIPIRLRVQVGLDDGDFVEAKAERGKIVLTPKLLVGRAADREYTPMQRRALDARLAESLEQAKKGETYGPFETHQAMTHFLHRQVREARIRKTRTAKPRVR
jgi:AbrB family looped-hinge helix DNA binding protein